MSKLLAYLQLMRLPTVFTAMADIFLGYLLVHGRFESEADFLLLLAASSGLYLSGMVFNDVFDRRVDAEERPGRPIPSGRISLASAVGLGVVLILIGLGAAVAVGIPSLIVAGLLVAAVLGYDSFLKKTPLGPLGMGICRFLNVMLGASALESTAALWTMPQLQVAGGLGVYIIGVTWFARQEARMSSSVQLAAAMGIVNLGLAVLIGFVLNWPEGIREQVTLVLLLLAIVALTINRRMTAAAFDPRPEKVQAAIKTLLLSLVMVDASIILFTTGVPAYALLTAGLLVPALILGRMIPMT